MKGDSPIQCPRPHPDVNGVEAALQRALKRERQDDERLEREGRQRAASALAERKMSVPKMRKGR